MSYAPEHPSHDFRDWNSAIATLKRCSVCGCWEGTVKAYAECDPFAGVLLPEVLIPDPPEPPKCWKCQAVLSSELDRYWGKTEGMELQCIQCRPRSEGGFGADPEPFG